MNEDQGYPPPELGMQEFKQVEPEQLPDPTVVGDQSFLDSIMGMGGGIYMLVMAGSAIWFALSVFSPGPPSFKAGLVAFGMLFALMYF